jgi:hypothetical protein
MKKLSTAVLALIALILVPLAMALSSQKGPAQLNPLATPAHISRVISILELPSL